MKIYLDNCCFNRPFDDQSQLKINLESQAKLAVQQDILNGFYTLVWSYMLEYENMQNPYEMRKESIIKWKDIATEYITENEEILVNAEQLLKLGIKPKDAIHISCAKYAKCDCFLTTDIGILKKGNACGIKILNPIEFVREEAEKYE